MATRWSDEQAKQWQQSRPWICGVNFIPSSAGNTTEFWQRESFDAETIDRELAQAAKTGFNSVRVFIQYLVWKHDPRGLIDRLDHFLLLADQHGVSTMPVLFDDCSFGDPPIAEPTLGKQRDLIPGMIASNWTPSPGLHEVTDESAWPSLEKYITEIVSRFGNDRRVVVWDLYNEPGNSQMGGKSLPLLHKSFEWARSVKPIQPLTAGPWNNDLKELNAAQVESSDVISFHFYGKHDDLKAKIERYESFGRPVLCTEWMARLLGSRWDTDLPLLKEKKVGCYSWGLVNGRMQCQFPWWNKRGEGVREKWFHDLYHRDGTPYDPAEIATIQKLSPR